MSKFKNPFFNEFVFHAIITAPPDVKNKLPIDLLRHTTSPEKIKAFADKASFAKQLEMLSRLGSAVSITVAPPGYMSKEKLEEILDNYNNNNRLEDVDDMIKHNVFVQTDREIMAIHSLMAMNCHSETYMLNRDYSLIAAKIAWDQDIDTRTADIELIKQVMADHRLICKLVMHSLLQQDFVDGSTGYKAKELLILLYLFVNRENYIPLKTIHKFFQHTYTLQVVNRSIRGLKSNDHISQFPKQYKYSITGIGIQVLASYVNRLIGQTLSF